MIKIELMFRFNFCCQKWFAATQKSCDRLGLVIAHKMPVK